MNDRRLAVMAAVAMVPAIAFAAVGAIEAATAVVLACLAATTVPVDLCERRIPTPVVHTAAVGVSVSVIIARVAFHAEDVIVVLRHSHLISNTKPHGRAGRESVGCLPA